MPRPIKLSVPIPDVSVQVDATSFNAETLTMTFPDKPVRYLLPSVKYLQVTTQY